MRQRHSRLHAKHLRIERAEAHGTRKILDRTIRIATLGSQEAAKEPGSRQVGIESKSPVNERNAQLEVPRQMRKRVAASRESDGVFLAKLNGSAGKACAFGDLG